MASLEAEKLIEAVKRREILYVSSLKSYKNSNAKKECGKRSPTSSMSATRKEVSEIYDFVRRFVSFSLSATPRSAARYTAAYCAVPRRTAPYCAVRRSIAQI